MSVITEWLERVEAEKKDEGFYIGDFDVQINNICVICNVSDIICNLDSIISGSILNVFTS